MKFSLVVLVIVPLVLADEVIVQTKYGQLRGTREQHESKYIDKFLGIPFALPPVGLRRFQKPEPPTPWQGLRNATQFGPACPQPADKFTKPFNLITNEDCLYLNVFRPKTTSNSNLPVMVFIHGGGYFTGSGSMYPGTVLALEDVIVVTINYRLGVLGFMSTEDKYAPGNYGMLDQVMALQWVKDCIASFGGNPNRVTIFGESVGATSVSLHLISPLSRGLFHGAIMQSGTSLNPWAVSSPYDNPSPLKNTKIIAKDVGCLHFRTRNIVKCLKRKTAEELVTAGAKIVVTQESMPWPAVVEKFYSFLPDTPRAMIDRGDALDVPVIRGVNKDEYTELLDASLGGLENGMSLTVFKKLIHVFLYGRYSRNHVQIKRKIDRMYMASVNSFDWRAIRSAYMKICDDDGFYAGTVLETQLQAKRRGHNPVFLYEFGYRSPNSNLPEWYGVVHASEVPYIFGAPSLKLPGIEKLYPWSWTDEDRSVSRLFISMWTNFAKYGNPAPQDFAGTHWQPFTPNQQAYLYIDSPPRVRFNLRQKEMNLWNNVIPSLSPSKLV